MTLPAAAHEPGAETHRFEFTGPTGEYFRLWIVNLGLTVLTFGFYLPWAKVRTLRWFYRHTRVAGASFDYTADPWRILRGRVIAVTVLVVSAVASEAAPVVSALVGIALFIASPWLIVRARTFRLQHTVYRNVRFSFSRAYGEAAKVYALFPVMAGFSFGLLQPWARFRQQRCLVDNAGCSRRSSACSGGRCSSRTGARRFSSSCWSSRR